MPSIVPKFSTRDGMEISTALMSEQWSFPFLLRLYYYLPFNPLRFSTMHVRKWEHLLFIYRLGIFNWTVALIKNTLPYDKLYLVNNHKSMCIFSHTRCNSFFGSIQSLSYFIIWIFRTLVSSNNIIINYNQFDVSWVNLAYLLPKFVFQNSAASAFVIRNWSPANKPFGNIAFSSLNICENTKLSFVKFRR